MTVVSITLKIKSKQDTKANMRTSVPVFSTDLKKKKKARHSRMHQEFQHREAEVGQPLWLADPISEFLIH